MAATVTPPPQNQFAKLSSEMLQYVFDLEMELEQSFHVKDVAWTFVGGIVIGFIVGYVI